MESAMISMIKETEKGYEFCLPNGEVYAEVKVNDTGNIGKYKINVTKGIANGKVTYARNWEDLNNKSVAIAKLA